MDAAWRTAAAIAKNFREEEGDKDIASANRFVVFVLQAWTGKYTNKEFDVAHKRFKGTKKPLISTFFKNADIRTGSARREDLKSLWTFQDKLKRLEHFQTDYDNIEHLKRQFRDQLDKILERSD